MRQSSANSRVWDEVTHWGKSFKYTRHNNGPSTVPWRTPGVTGLVSDEPPSRTTVWSRWEKGCRYTHSTRCLLKNEPCTYQKKFDWLRLPLFKTSLTDSLWHLPSKSIQPVNFPHLNGVHIFFCLAWYNFLFIWISKYNFFFLRKSEYNFFFLKKPGPPPGYEMGGPLSMLINRIMLI